MLYVGVDLGGTNIAAGVVTEDGKILHRDETPTLVGRHYSEILKDMADLILKVVRDSGHTVSEIHSIGIGSPGVADREKGVIVFASYEHIVAFINHFLYSYSFEAGTFFVFFKIVTNK